MGELYFRKTYKEFFEFVSSAQNELIILSPYIKLEPIKLLLEKVRPEVRIIVVARWKMSDLIFGSSDIEVFEYLTNLNCNFYINNKIHLKVIVKDKKNILIGSANITGGGLGLFESSNIEAIAIDILDEKYLPSVYSILRESLLVDRDLVKKISEELIVFQDIKHSEEEIKPEIEKIENLIFKKLRKKILVYDFIFTLTPELFIESIRSNNFSDIIKHDLKILKLTNIKITKDVLRQAFLESDAYLWQQEHIKGKVLFGKYSELLHNNLIDDPRPYRKQVKELVTNMYNWTKEFSDEFKIIEHKHTSSIIKK